MRGKALELSSGERVRVRGLLIIIKMSIADGPLIRPPATISPCEGEKGRVVILLVTPVRITKEAAVNIAYVKRVRLLREIIAETQGSKSFQIL